VKCGESTAKLCSCCQQQGAGAVLTVMAGAARDTMHGALQQGWASWPTHEFQQQRFQHIGLHSLGEDTEDGHLSQEVVFARAQHPVPRHSTPSRQSLLMV
jgi:hypothetical protein